MTTHQHLLLIAIFAVGTWVWLWPIAPAMLYFFALINGDIPWKRQEEE